MTNFNDFTAKVADLMIRAMVNNKPLTTAEITDGEYFAEVDTDLNKNRNYVSMLIGEVADPDNENLWYMVEVRIDDYEVDIYKMF